MPGSLIPCVPNRLYQLTFWSIERDPAIFSSDFSPVREAFKYAFKKQFQNCRLAVACETATDGYCHNHVICRTDHPCKISLKFIKLLQGVAAYAKSNGKLPSVRAFHPRRGATEDFVALTKYLTESKYKVKPTDDGVLLSSACPIDLYDRCYYHIRKHHDPYFLPLMLSLRPDEATAECIESLGSATLFSPIHRLSSCCTECKSYLSEIRELLALQ